MIVPRTRLIIWFAAVVLPFAALAGTVPASATASAAIVFAFLGTAIVDAALARTRLNGITVLLPELVRWQKDREETLEIRVHNEPQIAREVRIGLAVPVEIESGDESLAVQLPGGTESSQLEWKFTPRKRGCYVLDQVYFEGGSPLGFWGFRKVQPVRSELRVYPDLFAERKNVAALFLRRGQLGVHAMRQAGQGREFEKLREYLPGDSVNDVHWKASAKRGHPVTKVYQVERSHEVYVVIDASRLTARLAPAGPAKDSEQMESATVLERFVTAGLLLGHAAEQQGDQFGLITFSDRVLSFVRARNGQAHYDACRDRLYTLQPQPVSPDFEELCSLIRTRLRKRALLVFLTALDDPLIAENFIAGIDLVCRQHLVLVNMLKPQACAPIFTNPNVEQIDDIYWQLGGHFQWEKLRELEKVLRRRGVRFATLSSEKLAADLIEQHANVRARQLI